MSRFPSMPLFAGDMLADTEHLTNEELGVYHRLLYAMWRRNGWVPDDDRDLARICRVTAFRWRRLKPRMMQFLIRNEAGELSQKKLLKVRANVENLSKKMRENSAKRWHPDSKENNDIAYADGYARARATPKPKPNKKDSSRLAPSFHARENGNGSAPAAAGSLGLEGRSPQPPIAKGRAPPPDKPWPPVSTLLAKVYPNGKAAAKHPKPGNGAQPGRHRSRAGKTAPPGRTAKNKPGAQKGAEAESKNPIRS